MASASGQYRGVDRLPDGRWRAYITDRLQKRYEVGQFGTATLAALAHDRALLHLLGQRASSAMCNFRAAFSRTELRFLHGRHAPRRGGGDDGATGIITMLRVGTYDAEFARFAARVFDAPGDQELACEAFDFRLNNLIKLKQLREAAVVASGESDRAERAKAERDAERGAFLEDVKNKAMDEAWVRIYLSTRRGNGQHRGEECSWPEEFASASDDQLIYLPNGSFWVDEMTKF